LKNKVPFDILTFLATCLKKLSKSVDVCQSYSKPKQCRFLKHSVYSILQVAKHE